MMVSPTPGLLVALFVYTSLAMQCHQPFRCLIDRYSDYNTVSDCLFGILSSEQTMASFQKNTVSCEGNQYLNGETPIQHTNNEKPIPRNKLRRKLKGSKRQKRKKKRKSRRKRRP